MSGPVAIVEKDLERLAKIEDVIERQKGFLHRIPDPETRDRAESHLITLVGMREELREACGQAE